MTAGLNVRERAEDWPATMTFGVVIPLTPNPVPVMDTALTVRSALPVFEMVRLELPEVPVTMLPKLIELLLTEI